MNADSVSVEMDIRGGDSIFRVDLVCEEGGIDFASVDLSTFSGGSWITKFKAEILC